MINHAPKSFPGSNNCDTDKTNSKDQGNILHNNFQYYIVILINIKGPEYDAQSSKNPCSRFQVNGKIGQMNAMKCSNINKNHISSALNLEASFTTMFNVFQSFSSACSNDPGTWL